MKTAALSTLLRLLLSAVPVSAGVLRSVAALLLLSLFLYFCPFYFLCVDGPLLLHRAPRRPALTSRGQVAVTVDTGFGFIERAVSQAILFPRTTIEFTIGMEREREREGEISFKLRP